MIAPGLGGCVNTRPWTDEMDSSLAPFTHAQGKRAHRGCAQEQGEQAGCRRPAS